MKRGIVFAGLGLALLAWAVWASEESPPTLSDPAGAACVAQALSGAEGDCRILPDPPRGLPGCLLIERQSDGASSAICGVSPQMRRPATP